MTHRVAIIGFGEAGQAFTSDPRWRAETVAYDVLCEQPQTGAELERTLAACNVKACASAQDAAASAPLVFSLVTADTALTVAEAVAPALHQGGFFIDGNSAAPQTKRAAADVVQAAGAHYIDAVIMAPVLPAALDVQLIVSGPGHEEAVALLHAIGFGNVRSAGPEVGRAAAIKMIRSVMIKGIEALTAECLIAAAEAGVTEDVVGSLGPDWRRKADYNLDRMLVHGTRRAAEMRAVSTTLEGLGIEPAMTRATVAWQEAVGALGIDQPPDGLDAKLEAMRRYKPERA